MNYFLNALTFAQAGEGGPLGNYGMIFFWVAMIGVFYFILIRPQRKQQKEHAEMVSNLEVGTEVVTIGGFKGKIVEVKEDAFIIEVAPETRVEVVKTAVGRKAN